MWSPVGIDLGDQYCVIAINGSKGIDVISNQESSRLTPTMVTYTNKRRFAGALSHQRHLEYLETTIVRLKQLIYLPFTSPRCEKLRSFVPYKLVETPGGLTGVQITFKDRQMTILPEQALSYLLKSLAELARQHLPNNNDYVITVPQCWGELQRRSILFAAKLSGINCLSLINSNTAAALNYYKSKEKLLQEMN